MSTPQLIKASLVYDGGERAFIPPDMGEPRSDQLQGTAREQVAELCGRVCYDSLGAGRNSDEYHQHIREVNHLSVVEHTPITVQLTVYEGEMTRALIALANRPGVSFSLTSASQVRVVIDYRAAIEWAEWTPLWLGWIEAAGVARHLGNVLTAACASTAPRIIPAPADAVDESGSAWRSGPCSAVAPVFPEDGSERWISVYMACSRRCSLEQIRHDWQTAYTIPRDEDVGISQRSTRYVDESASPYVTHPLETYAADRQLLPEALLSVQAIKFAKMAYDANASMLEHVLTLDGVDKLTARKQARGAARGYLGNAIQTQFIFSASVRQWMHMLRLRASRHADAEIRVLYAGYNDYYPSVWKALTESRYGHTFTASFVPRPSPDGIGRVLEYAGKA